MRDSSNLGDFIFVKSEKIQYDIPKGHFFLKVPTRTAYQPSDEEEEQVLAKGIKEQIESTISSMSKKELKDVEKAYFVIGVSTKIYDSPEDTRVIDLGFERVLKNLSAEVLSYLNVEHNRLLVSSPLSSLKEILNKEKHSKRYFKDVKRISLLTFGEQISGRLQRDTEWSYKPKPLLIELVPNITNEKRIEYAESIRKHLKKLSVAPFDGDETEFVTANLTKEATKELLRNSNFVFRVSEVPEGILEKNSATGKVYRVSHAGIQGKVSSIDAQAPNFDKLPAICVMDSGVNKIPQLTGLLYRDGIIFQDFDDGHGGDGHGTPIACLAAYGEGLSHPKAKIISYKIYSDIQPNIRIECYRRAISKYSNQTRIFLSSVNFRGREQPGVAGYLDKLIQRNNICVVLSAGNIEPNKVKEFAAEGTPCNQYVCDHPVLDPAQAVNIVAVGAISKKESPNSVSRKNGLSPFTTCGTTNEYLYRCPKPEVVQHGGNYCEDGTSLGVESFNKNGILREFLGTSFSAPIFAHNLATIEAKYGKKFHNAETIKAIALASASNSTHRCMGFGETQPWSMCDDLHALICSEGEILLPDKSDKANKHRYESKISFHIPKSIRSIKMFIVHSDNQRRVPVPFLCTYLTATASKLGHEHGRLRPTNRDELTKKSHMKVFEWAFKQHSMESDWDFYIKPELTNREMLQEHVQEITVRYGCAILITSRTPIRAKPLSEEMRHLNKDKVISR